MAKSDANLSVDETSSTANSPASGLLPLLFVGNAAMDALYSGVGGMLLPLQIEQIDPANKVAGLGLGFLPSLSRLGPADA
ncbi:hypothetical protein ACIO14_28400 [Nocardia fluminea]|uniref:hypothetical protein n=1 Tax=Nocardia fluminea TaxID=134984 RepID=UPI00382606DD